MTYDGWSIYIASNISIHRYLYAIYPIKITQLSEKAEAVIWLVGDIYVCMYTIV